VSEENALRFFESFKITGVCSYLLFCVRPEEACGLNYGIWRGYHRECLNMHACVHNTVMEYTVTIQLMERGTESLLEI
jgi:hypothetical protein